MVPPHVQVNQGMGRRIGVKDLLAYAGTVVAIMGTVGGYILDEAQGIARTTIQKDGVTKTKFEDYITSQAMFENERHRNLDMSLSRIEATQKRMDEKLDRILLRDGK